MNKNSHPNHNFDVKLLSFAIVITIVTLLLIAVTSLFSTFFSSYKNYIYLFAIVFTAITLIITVYSLFSTRVLSIFLKRSLIGSEATMASAIIDRTLDGEFIHETSDGIALYRLVELVKNAKEDITIVSTMDNSLIIDDKRDTTELRKAKEKYFIAVMRQIERNKDGFHYREIIQSPMGEEKSISRALTIHSPTDHQLAYIARSQGTPPSSVMLRFIAENIATPFTIIDERYIVLPLMGLSGRRQRVAARQRGILFLEDHKGALVRELERAFDDLWDISRPLPN